MLHRAQPQQRQVDEQARQRLVNDGIAPVAARVLAARGIKEAAELDPNIACLPSINGGDAAKAAQLIADAVREDKRICIIGDYDADGMCSIALGVLALEAIGAKVSWLVDSRESEERGLNPTLVGQSITKGAQLLLTVDNGTSSHAGVAAARAHGVQVVVTDHHLPTVAGPVDADAIANPHLDDSGFPHKDICGTAVLLLVLREVYRLCASQKRVSSFIDLVAVATIADVMPLNSSFNRKLVMNGISQIRKGNCRNAFKAMMPQNFKHCDSHMLGFRIAPMLNSASRMASPEVGVETLLAQDISEARRHVEKLSSYNRERKMLCHSTTQEALEIADVDNSFAFAYKPHWHRGIAGIVAHRLVDHYKVPAAVMRGEDGKITGSMRSVPGVCVHSALSAVADTDPDGKLLGNWGGHSGAAGFHLTGDLQIFTKLLREKIASTDKAELKPQMTDGELRSDEIQYGSFSWLAELPWGKDFPRPVFTGSFYIEEGNPAVSGNGFRYKLGLNGHNFSSWAHSPIGSAGQEVNLLYSVALDNHNPDKLFILPEHVI